MKYTEREIDPSEEKRVFTIGGREVELSDELIEHCGLKPGLEKLAAVLCQRLKAVEIDIYKVGISITRAEPLSEQEKERRKERDFLRGL